MVDEENLGEEESLSPWDPSKRYVGRWQITVLWYELPAKKGKGLVLVEKSFSSKQEMNEYLEPLVDDGTIFDLFGTIESSWVEEDNS